jgi:hypothetical protein
MDQMLTAYQDMIRVHGWNGTAATLGMSKSQLEARVYEVKGSGMRVDTALLIQSYAGTKHFAQAVAHASGGVYIDLPEAEAFHGEDLESKFRDLICKLGDLSRTYGEAKADGEIDRRERAELEGIAQQMHKTLQELMALMFHVYCRPTAPNPSRNDES